MGLLRAAFCLAAVVGASIPMLPVAAAPADAALTEIVARVKPSVVAVGTYQRTRSPPFLFRGTGFVVGDGTLIATAAHVVAESLSIDNRETMMILAHVPGKEEGQGREAKAIAVDKVHDVALLRITGEPLAAMPLGDSGAVRDGLDVALTGFPMGTALGFFPVTHRGIIASLVPVALPGANAAQLNPRVIRGLKSGSFILFQLDATTYPGHSGSPVYDTDSGNVVGIVNLGVLKSTKDSAIGQPTGISFAVPIRHLQQLMDEAR